MNPRSLLRRHLKAIGKGGPLVAVDLETPEGLYEEITLAAASGPKSTVVSGDIERVVAMAAGANIVGQGFKYDLRCFWEQGYSTPFKGMMLELKAAAHMLDENRKGFKPYGLKSLGPADLGCPRGISREAWDNWLKGFGSQTPETLEEYASIDVLVTRLLMLKYWTALKNARMLDEYLRIECPMMLIAAEMETNGIAIDREMLVEAISEKTVEVKSNKAMMRMLFPDGPWLCQRDGCNGGIYTWRGKNWKPSTPDRSGECIQCEGTGENDKAYNSPKVLSKILFDEYGLTPVSWTDTGEPSTEREALETLIEDAEGEAQEFLSALLTQRKNQKLLSFLQDYRDRGTDTIHPSLDPWGTVAGRWSASNPNLQQVPVSLRKLFIARPGMKLVSVDFEQAELYTMAVEFNEPAIAEAYEAGVDLHARTASIIYGCKVKDVTDEQRKTGKTVNFALPYGLQPKTLAFRLGVSHSKADRIIDQVMGGYTGLFRGIKKAKQEAHRNGYVRITPSRIRRLPLIKSKHFREQLRAENQAVNGKIQGRVAYQIKDRMIAARLSVPEAIPILQVHDEAVFEVDAKRADEISKDLVDIFEQDVEGIRLKASATVSDRWSKG